MKLELTPEVEAGLLAQAQAKGLSLEAYASQLLRCAATPAKPMPGRKSLIELFSPLKGLDLDFSRNPSIGRPPDL